MPRMGEAVLPANPHHIVQRGRLTGRDHFVENVEAILRKGIEKRSPGGPQKTSRAQHELLHK